MSRGALCPRRKRPKPKNISEEAPRRCRTGREQGSPPGGDLLYLDRAGGPAVACVLLLEISVDYEVVNPQTHQVEHATATVNSLLSGDGIRFMLTSMVRNFMNFGPGRDHPGGHGRGRSRRTGGSDDRPYHRDRGGDAAQSGDLDPSWWPWVCCRALPRTLAIWF